jgi:hypothetical protein
MVVKPKNKARIAENMKQRRPALLFRVTIFVRRGRRVPLWRRVSVLCKCFVV